MQKKKLKISVISQIHYGKLVLRSLLLVAALAAYIVSHLNGSGSMFGLKFFLNCFWQPMLS